MTGMTGRCRRHHQNQCEGSVDKGLCFKHAVIWQVMQADWQARAYAAEGRQRKPRTTTITRCLRGHPYTPANTVTKADGHRRCRTCMNAQGRASRAKKSNQKVT